MDGVGTEPAIVRLPREEKNRTLSTILRPQQVYADNKMEIKQ